MPLASIASILVLFVSPALKLVWLSCFPSVIVWNHSRLCLQMMQEWLGQHKLDRKALAALAGNAQAVQVYEDYLRQQVQDVMEDLLAEFDEPAPAQGTHLNMSHAPAFITHSSVSVAYVRLYVQASSCTHVSGT